MKIQYAVFDLDGTLINSLIFWDRLWDLFGEMFFDGKKFRPDAESDKAIRTMTLVDAMNLMHEKYNIGDSGKQLLDITNETCAKFYSEVVEYKDGAEEFLRTLKENGTKMCIATATSLDLVKYVAKRLDIGRYIDKIFSCADIGKGKDKPDIFLIACDYVGAKPSDVYMFEDSAVSITTAKKLGMKTVGIYDAFNYGHDVIKANSDFYIDKGETLMKLL